MINTQFNNPYYTKYSTFSNAQVTPYVQQSVDSVEISQKNSQGKKSNTKKFLIGLGVCAAAVAAVLLLSKGKSLNKVASSSGAGGTDLKNATKATESAADLASATKATEGAADLASATKVTEGAADVANTTKATQEFAGDVQRTARTVESGVLKNVELRSVGQAQEYFEQAGIKTVFANGTEKHLADLNSIKDDLIALQRNGVQIQPDAIVFCNWRNASETETALRKLNLGDDAISGIKQTLNGNSGMWATVESVQGGGNIVFVNNSSGNLKKFAHEMGHIHQDLETSFWHSQGLKGADFRQKQCDILGLGTSVHRNNNYAEWSGQSLDDLFRTNCESHGNIPGLKDKLAELYPELNGNYETLFFAPVQNAAGGVDAYYINAKRMIGKMYSESGVYAPTKTFENVAEIFEGLNRGKTYSDEVMLIYDFCGGGRVPNKVINGMKYDDYIRSLYENKELVGRLKNLLDIRKL